MSSPSTLPPGGPEQDNPAAPVTPQAVPAPQRRRRVLVAALTALALLVGLPLAWTGLRQVVTAVEQSRARAAAAEFAAQRDRGISATVEAMNQALARKDQAAYLAQLYPGSTTLARTQAAVFTGLTRMRMPVRYIWQPGDLERAPALTAQFGGDAVVANVAREYTLAGWDNSSGTEWLHLTFRRAAGKEPGTFVWLVSSDIDSPATLPRPAYTEPWSVGDVSVASTSTVLVVADAGQSERAQELAERIQTLVEEVGRRWKSTSWNGKVVVYAVTEPRFVQAWFGDKAATHRGVTGSADVQFDAVVGEISGTGPASQGPAGLRMVLSPAMVRGQDGRRTDEVLRHELTHVVTGRMSSGKMPTWIVEGLAEYTASRAQSTGSVDGVRELARRGLTAAQWKELRSGTFTLELDPVSATFYDGTSDEVGDRYVSAWLACLYIAHRYGERALGAFYVAAAEAANDGSPQQAEVAALATLKTDRASLIRNSLSFGESVRKHFE